MENTRRFDSDEAEIDLLELFIALKRRLWLILLTAVVFGAGAGAFSKYVLVPQYTSTAMVYILSKETTLTSLADLQIGSQLTKDYKIIVTSRPVLEEVIEELAQELTYEAMKGKITIGNPADTRILSISVQDADPVRAKALATAVAKISSEYIGDIMEMVPPKIIEEGVVPKVKSSPSNGRNAMMGAMVGMVLVCGIIVLEVILNDTIRSEEDVERYLGISVLASVPERKKSGGGYGHEDERAVKGRRKKKAGGGRQA